MKKSKLGIFLMVAGAFLIIGAAVLAVYNVHDSKRADEAARAVFDQLLPLIEDKKNADTVSPGDDSARDESETLYETETEVPEHIAYPDMPMPTVTVEEQRYIGYIEIPSLELVLPVAGEEWDYSILAKAPCLYKGSAYKDNIIIAGHNYTAHFGRLDNLSKGAPVRFTDVSGNVFEYEVGWTELISETDAEGMISGEDWDMTLFTCNYSGDKRFTVRCIRITN